MIVLMRISPHKKDQTTFRYLYPSYGSVLICSYYLERSCRTAAVWRFKQVTEAWGKHPPAAPRNNNNKNPEVRRKILKTKIKFIPKENLEEFRRRKCSQNANMNQLQHFKTV